MTAIVGIVHKDQVWMGGDSAGSTGQHILIYSNPKVFVKGDYIFGYTTSFRMGQILEFYFTAPERIEGESVQEHIIKRFIPYIRSLFESNNYKDGGTFLVGYRGVLFQVQSDYHVTFSETPYMACGAGEELALGSLHTTHNLTMQLEPERRIEFALSAASEFNNTVRAPFTICHSS